MGVKVVGLYRQGAAELAAGGQRPRRLECAHAACNNRETTRSMPALLPALACDRVLAPQHARLQLRRQVVQTSRLTEVMSTPVDATKRVSASLYA